jgi:SAM-dependent methyltransferase
MRSWLRSLRAEEFTKEKVDPQFEARRQHAWNKICWSVPESSRRGRFLDIGCGIGNGLVAALQHGFTTAVGIDRDFKEFAWFDVSHFDTYCSAYGVEPTRAIMVEGDLFNTNFAPRGFECVFMLDSIEHVPDPHAFIETAARYVAPGGVLLIDTCPLFYSKVGHHLFNYLSPERYPWAHFRRDFNELIVEHKVDEWSLHRFRELNGVTHDQVRKSLLTSGLQIASEHRSTASEKDVALLEEHRPKLDLSAIADEKLLFEDWILIVG